MAKLLLEGSDAAIKRIATMFAGTFKAHNVSVTLETSETPAAEPQTVTENETEVYNTADYKPKKGKK